MAIFPNLCVSAERDLRFALTVSNYNPPEADKSSKYFNGWMPVPLHLSGVVNPDKIGRSSLTLLKLSHFRMNTS